MAGCGIWVWTVTFTRWKIAESPQSLHKHFESHICLSNKRVWSKQRLRAVWNEKFHWSPLSVFTLCLLQLVFARFFLEYLACFHAPQRRLTKKSKSSAALLSVIGLASKSHTMGNMKSKLVRQRKRERATFFFELRLIFDERDEGVVDGGNKEGRSRWQKRQQHLQQERKKKKLP